jgi:hypothetical protein
MKLIPLTRGFSAMVDDEDYDELSQYSWHVYPAKHTNYASRHTSRKHPPRTTISMARQIMKATSEDVVIDHIDFNGLNN